MMDSVALCAMEFHSRLCCHFDFILSKFLSFLVKVSF